MQAGGRSKRTLIAYCVLADKLRSPGVGVTQALSPFLATVCREFSGQLFDAAKFSASISLRYGLHIPRLASLGLTEQLAQDGFLVPLSKQSGPAVYRYAEGVQGVEASSPAPVTEGEIESLLASFVARCRADKKLDHLPDERLEDAFFDRLLNVDSMRLLSRREASIALKKTAGTLGMKQSTAVDDQEKEELHLDFMVSDFLLEVRDTNPSGFERLSDVAFANMAAEALACFREPPNDQVSLDRLTVYLDSPLLLDMLGVNSEYAEYGAELLEEIKRSGAQPAIFDHCIAEAEATIHAQLAYQRSGLNRASARWGTSARPDLLAALANNVGHRAEQRLGIALHRDPDVALHRRAQTTVGDIESEMTRRMLAWGNAEAKEYDRKSVWAMLSIRNATTPCQRICDSGSILLTRNTALVGIANDSWSIWLKGSTKHSTSHIERWAPVAMTDKQFAGYLWARRGGGSLTISKARLLAHCSAAVRPRADVKTRVYNLVLELSGSKDAEDIAALLEDREGAKALMRATHGDPEDVTRDRIPFILEHVKLAAGEFAAAVVREESQREIEMLREEHERNVERIRAEAGAVEAALKAREEASNRQLIQQQTEHLDALAQKEALQRALGEHAEQEERRKHSILADGLASGAFLYRMCRWAVALVFGVVCGGVALLGSTDPGLAAGLSVITGTFGFWFVPDFLEKPLTELAMWRLRGVVRGKDSTVQIPTTLPNFRQRTWPDIVEAST